jgi:hypothetical protein
MLNFDESEVVSLSLKGKPYTVQLPNNGQIEKYQVDLAACPMEKKGELLKDFLKDLGLPHEAYEQMNQRQVKQLLKALYSDEKN